MQSETAQLTIGYWPIRGRVQHILYLLHYLDTQYKFVPVTDKAAWIESKQSLIDDGLDFPNLPYMIDGDVKISENLAICMHIA